MSNIIRKVEEAIHPSKRERGPAGAAAHPPAGTGVAPAQAAPATIGASSGTGYPSADNYTNANANDNLSSGPAPNTAGPHKYDALNKLDPSVDSKPGQAGVTTGGPAPQPPTTGTGGTNVPEGTYGPHGSRVANAADPRVDSDIDRRHLNPVSGAAASGAPGVGHHAQAAPGVAAPGAAPGAKGAHNSDILNKLDPKVDSSATRGGI